MRRNLNGLICVIFSSAGVVGLSLILVVGGLAQIYRSSHLSTPIENHVMSKSKSMILSSKPFYFPAGGRQLLPDYRLVALYGAPNMPALGALGEQPLPATIARVKALAAAYQLYSDQPVYPTLEIIATIASAAPTSNGDYSQELPPAEVASWIVAARAAGVYVVLDLQPGRTDFLTQAKEYAELLEQPNVGLALDPEWRLTATQLPAAQIGSVNVAEINQTSVWLAGLTAANNLPQKLFIIQQFQLDMIVGRQDLDTSKTDLAYVVQMDGNGSQTQKQSTWRAIMADPPANVFFGWKNFYRVDQPILTPAETMAITPQPFYASYQ